MWLNEVSLDCASFADCRRFMTHASFPNSCIFNLTSSDVSCYSACFIRVKLLYLLIFFYKIMLALASTSTLWKSFSVSPFQHKRLLDSILEITFLMLFTSSRVFCWSKNAPFDLSPLKLFLDFSSVCCRVQSWTFLSTTRLRSWSPALVS